MARLVVGSLFRAKKVPGITKPVQDQSLIRKTKTKNQSQHFRYADAHFANPKILGHQPGPGNF
eukprot:scaffold7955_cov12-Tisochrysis_lutea.AAC.1